MPVHLSDEGCHSRVRLDAKTLAGHLKNDHGSLVGTAGFKFSTGRSAKASPLWQELEDLGLEIHDFRCDVCDKVLPLNHINILNHLRPHAGKTRRVRKGGDFWFTLSFKPVQPTDEDFELLDE